MADEVITQVSELTPEERKQVFLLIIDPDDSDREKLRKSLSQLGYESVSDAPDHTLGYKKLMERPFSHCIFSVENTTIPASEFVKIALDADEKLVLVSTSSEPDLDEIFDLLVLGTRGYLVKPFDQESIEYALATATKGKPFSESLLNAPDRNETLTNVLVNNLDKLADGLRKADQSESARRELASLASDLNRSVELALTFAKGGETQFLEVLEDVLLQRSVEPATALGRLRRRLAQKRSTKEE